VKRIIFTVLVIVLAMGIVTAYAGDACCAKGDVKATKADAAASKACCPGKTGASCAGKTMSGEKADVKAEGDKVCPDVTDRSALMNFHEAMHPMHVAVKESNFDVLREKLPTLVDATKGVGDYKCAGYENCSDACRKVFDGNKGALMQSVENLKEACKGKDNEKVTLAFDIMHEAYITFANTCSHDEEEPVEAKTAVETQ